MSSSDRDDSPGSKADEKIKADEKRETQVEDAPEVLSNPYFVGAVEAKERKLPAWLDHFNAKDLKRLFKCSLAVWIMTLLIVINPTLRVIGRSAFMGCIVLFIAPPAGIVFIQLIMAASVLLGVGAGWAWGVIAMKAALATKPKSETLAQYHVLMQAAQAQNVTSPALYAKIQVLNGYFLDTRVSITYFCMMGLFIYFIARLRVAFPKLLLVQILSSIVSVIYFCQAPVFPTFNGTLAKVIVIPCAIAAGLGIVCNVLIFPTSSTSEALDGMRDVLQPMPTFLDACLLGLKHPALDMSEAKLTALRIKVLSTYKQLDPLFKFLPIDLSIGRWGADDLSSLSAPFRELIIGFIGLTEIHRQKQVRKEKTIQALNRAQAEENREEMEIELGRHQIDQAAEFHVKSSNPSRNNIIKKSIQALAEPGEHLVQVLKEALDAIGEALTQAHVLKKAPNHPEMLQRHTAVLLKLRTQRDIFLTSTTQYLPDTSRQLFDDRGLLRIETGSLPALTGLMLGVLLQERLHQLAGALEQLLTRIVELETTRTRVRVWLPTRLRALFRWIGHEDPSEDKITAADIGDNLVRMPTAATLHPHLDAESISSSSKSARAELISMRKPNSRRRSRGGRILLAVTDWFGNDQGIFGLRMVILTIGLSTPAVVKHSAGFFYRNRGLWAVIMAQLALVPYTADLLYGIFVRAFGTVVGGLIGMTAWYVGAGHGDGNPYGMAASLAVVIVIIMWWRLFSSPALMPAGIMMGATAYLVAGYSWIDTHIPAWGNPGIGYMVFWKRLVLVFIGFAGTLVVNFVPKPPSANRHYRHLLADSLVSIRDRYALFASNWRDPAPDLHDVVEEEAIAVGEALLAMSGPIKLTVLEFSSSNFDTKTLVLVCNQCMLLNQNLTQVLLYTAKLSDEQRHRIIPATGAVSEDLITELMAVLSLVQQALKSGDPLPAMLPTPLFTKAIAHARRHVEEGLRDSSGIPGHDAVDCEGMRRYIVILNSLVQMLAAVDELVLILKRAVGETSNIAVLEV